MHAQCTVINPRRAYTVRVSVLGRVFLSVKSHLTSGASVHPENNIAYSRGQKICGEFSETALLQKYTASCVVGYCSDIPRTFLMAEHSKGPKMANNRLNSTWNTTRCKAASFFCLVFIFCLKSSVYFPLRMRFNCACTFKDCAHAHTEGLALQCSSFACDVLSILKFMDQCIITLSGVSETRRYLLRAVL